MPHKRKGRGGARADRVRKAYDAWAAVYDTNENRTRDLNAEVLRRDGAPFAGKRVLEVGCGSGLNTEWLAEHACEVVAIDISDTMLNRARQRVGRGNVHFEVADITRPWKWEEGFGVVVVNLVLEHISNVAHVFFEAARVLKPDGSMYIAELHPYRQLQGSQARFQEPDSGLEVLVPVVRHSISEFVNAALDAGFRIRELGEHAGHGDELPRLFTMWLDRDGA